MTRGDERGDQTITDVLRALASGRGAAAATEGLRERKKRLTRQLISDTATGMFLERGFDEVRVAEIAAACDVSEKTVFNYFPTKESLVFDRTDELVAATVEALRDHHDGLTIGEAATRAALAEVERSTGWWHEMDDAAAMAGVQRFAALVESTPSLRAARREMFERVVDAATNALAERAGVSADDPEPYLAALAVVGMWRVAFHSLQRHADPALTSAEVRARVVADVRRAARVAEAGLSSFDAAVRRDGGRASAQDAAQAVQEARRQVAVAVRQARVAWRQVRELHDDARGEARGLGAQIRAEAKRDTQRIRREAKADALRTHARRHTQDR